MTSARPSGSSWSRTRRTWTRASLRRWSRRCASGSRARRLSGRARRRALPRRRSAASGRAGGSCWKSGDGQADAVAAELKALGYEAVVTSPDLTGRARVVEGRRRLTSKRSSQRCSRAGRRSSRPTPSTGSTRGPIEDAVRRLYALKGRREEQPTALLGRDVDALIELVPELAGETEALLRALLPGPYTVVVPNPARRLPWLAGGNPEAIGVRVPARAGRARRGTRARSCARGHEREPARRSRPAAARRPRVLARRRVPGARRRRSAWNALDGGGRHRRADRPA